MFTKIFKFIGNLFSLKNLVRVLAVGAGVKTAMAVDSCPDVGTPMHLPVDCTMPVNQDPFWSKMAIPETASFMTVPIKCVIATDYPGQRGVQVSVDRTDGKAEDSGQICDIQKSPTCNVTSSEFMDLIFKDKTKIYELLPFNTTTLRHSTFFRTSVYGCSYHDPECPASQVRPTTNVHIVCKAH